LPAGSALGVYRPRRPQITPLYRLVDAHYEEVKGQWEERFESRYGYWRGFVDGVVMRYLDCGVFSAGLARVKCRECQAEYIIACSCKGRGLCPSCGAKRAAAFAAFLTDEVLEPVAHRMWTFSVPKIIRPYFVHHRHLLGTLCRAAYETVHEMMAAAAEVRGVEGFGTGMVVVAQTAGDLLNVHPHLHGLAPRGGWEKDGAWVPVPYVDTDVAERLFRSKVLAFLKAEGLLSEERERLLLSWNHHTGFSVRDDVMVEPEDRAGLERLARYLLRPPVSLERMEWVDGTSVVTNTRRARGGQAGASEQLDALDFLARVIAHVPEPRLHMVRYLGYYSNVSRGRRRKGRETRLETRRERDETQSDGLTPAQRQAQRRAWAQLVRRVYEVDPLVCAKCGGEMRIVSVILDPAVIRKILDHIRTMDFSASRDPPPVIGPLAAAS
jgi:hypothetical protein